MPITIINGADINDTAILITADTQATPTNIYHIASGAINVGTDTIEIGDLAWGAVPVA
jgi:hypothetical protein